MSLREMTFIFSFQSAYNPFNAVNCCSCTSEKSLKYLLTVSITLYKMALKLFPQAFWFFHYRQGENNVIKEHEYVEERKEYEEILFIELLHITVQYDPLQYKARNENDQGSYPELG